MSLSERYLGSDKGIRDEPETTEYLPIRWSKSQWFNNEHALTPDDGMLKASTLSFLYASAGSEYADVL